MVDGEVTSVTTVSVVRVLSGVQGDLGGERGAGLRERLGVSLVSCFLDGRSGEVLPGRGVGDFGMVS